MITKFGSVIVSENGVTFDGFHFDGTTSPNADAISAIGKAIEVLNARRDEFIKKEIERRKIAHRVLMAAERGR